MFEQIINVDRMEQAVSLFGSFDENIKQIEKELSEIQDRLHELKIIGKVSVSGTVYAGVKIFIRDVKDEVRTDVKNVTFFYENGFVRRGKYEAPDTDVTKQVLNGFSST